MSEKAPVKDEPSIDVKDVKLEPVEEEVKVKSEGHDEESAKRKSRKSKKEKKSKKKKHRSRSKEKSKDRERSRSRSRSESSSRSNSKSRSRRHRSRTPVRKRRHSFSRSYSKSVSRSRSRSPGGHYMSRGRHGFRPHNHPRGRRPYRGRGNYDRYRHGGRYSRSRSYSRSKSKSPSRSPSPRPPVPKENPVFEEANESSDDDFVTKSSIQSEVNKLKPTDIKETQKKATQSFLAMLEEKKKSKMIPVVIASKPKDDLDSESSKKHGFVSSFVIVGGENKSESKENLSTDMEDDGWKVIDEAQRKSKKTDDHKPTAKELLERKRLKNGDLKPENNEPGKVFAESQPFDPKSVIGKVKMAKKSFVSKRKNKEEKPNLNSDYSWYQQYYANSYGLDAYSSAYSAYYTLVTCGDYSQKDLSEWMQQIGYTQPTFYDAHGDVKKEWSHYLDQHHKNGPVKVDTEEGEIKDEQEEVQRLITVNVPNVPSMANEMYYINQPEATENDDMEVESDGESLPPPGTPPLLPEITITTLTQAVTLPDGTELPAGTKQTIVHSQPIISNM
ncbi:hypothetical protein HDE_08932 [Halotydeus destructor]|nr:hypothetical protein HDE_08932 [Halotydeus destructor]